MFSVSLIDDPIRSALDANVRHFSKLVAYANIAVFVGVAIEGIGIAHTIVVWCKRRKRNKRERIQHEELSEMLPVGELRQPPASHSEEPTWVKVVAWIGLALVVFGVVGEWRWGFELENAHNDVHLYDLKKIEEADEKAGDAKNSALIAQDAATRAREEADAASVEAARIHRFLTPLSLTQKQMDDLRDALKPLADPNVVVVVRGYWDSPAAAVQAWHSLDEAGFKKASLDLRHGVPTLGMSASSPLKYAYLTGQITGVLMKAGIRPMMGLQGIASDSDPITILIGDIRSAPLPAPK